MLPIKIIIPQYIRTVQISKKQNASFYEWNGSTIKGKKKKLLLAYVKKEFHNVPNILPEHLKSEYCIGCFNKVKLVQTFDTLGQLLFHNKLGLKYILINKITKEKIIANQSQVGKPSFKLISGQDIFSGNLREHLRGTIFQAIKQSFLPYVKDMPIISNYPVRIKMYVYDTVKSFNDSTLKNEVGQRWDLGNRAYPYGKAFLDLLVTGTDGTNKIMEPKLIDDDRLHVTEDPQGGIFCPLRNNDDSRRKLVFIIEEDKRKIIKNNKFYNGKYEKNLIKGNPILRKTYKTSGQTKIQFIEGLSLIKTNKDIFNKNTRGESTETEDNLLT